mmetsp:Transcript_89434/g.172094  ORF Transcript_89434/g.172094 Transcript_89434/m.172094 type:complete len:203 (+) Transcript_89434:322-930(+)
MAQPVLITNLKWISTKQARSPSFLFRNNFATIQAVGKHLMPAGCSINDHKTLVPLCTWPHWHVQRWKFELVRLFSTRLLSPTTATTTFLPTVPFSCAVAPTSPAAATTTAMLALFTSLRPPPLKEILNKVVHFIVRTLLGKIAQMALQLFFVLIGKDIFNNFGTLVRRHLQECCHTLCCPLAHLLLIPHGCNGYNNRLLLWK